MDPGRGREGNGHTLWTVIFLLSAPVSPLISKLGTQITSCLGLLSGPGKWEMQFLEAGGDPERKASCRDLVGYLS